MNIKIILFKMEKMERKKMEQKLKVKEMKMEKEMEKKMKMKKLTEFFKSLFLSLSY